MFARRTSEEGLGRKSRGRALTGLLFGGLLLPDLCFVVLVTLLGRIDLSLGVGDGLQVSARVVGVLNSNQHKSLHRVGSIIACVVKVLWVNTKSSHQLAQSDGGLLSANESLSVDVLEDVAACVGCEIKFVQVSSIVGKAVADKDEFP